MGRLIDADKLLKYGACPNDCKGTSTCMKDYYEHLHCPIRVFDIESINDVPTVEAIPKADYETRLKADMVAMLTEIQLEIEELENPLDYDFEGYNQCAVDCEKLIQQKINELKGVAND